MRQSKKDAVRLNKLISEAGFCSRREADVYIEQERVTVNGHTAIPGQKVFRTDFIRIDGEPLRFIEKPVFEKPKKEFESKRITRRLGIKPKTRTKSAQKETSDSEGQEKVVKSKKVAPVKNAVAKDEKKDSEAKKWFSGRKKGK